MPRTLPCSGCGDLRMVTPHSRPQPMCQECRAALRAAQQAAEAVAPPGASQSGVCFLRRADRPAAFGLLFARLPVVGERLAVDFWMPLA